MNINTLVATYSDLTTADEISENESLLRVLIPEFLTQQQTILQLYKKLEAVLTDMSKQSQPVQTLQARNAWLQQQYDLLIAKLDNLNINYIKLGQEHNALLDKYDIREDS